MTEKQNVVWGLGEDGPLLLAQLNTALEANNRIKNWIKYYFTPIQTAIDQADHPDRSFPTLRTERETTGISSAELDRVITGSRQSAKDEYSIPYLAEILGSIRTCMDEMTVPLQSAAAQSAGTFVERKNALVQ